MKKTRTGRRTTGIRTDGNDLSFLSHTLEELTDFSPDADIFSYLATTLQEILGPEVVILISSFDPESRTVVLRSFEGLDSWLPEIERGLGRPLTGLSFSVPATAMFPLRTGECDELAGGLSTLTFGALPDRICQEIEHLPFFGRVYGTGISWKGSLHGVAILILPPGEKLENQQMISLFIRHVAGYLQRQQAEQELRKNEEKYRTLAESARDLIFIVNRSGKVTYVNSLMKSTFGISPEDTMGRDLEQVFSRPVAEQQKTYLHQVFTTGRPATADMCIQTLNGPAWYNTQLVPVFNSHNECEHIMGIARDITGRIQAEKLLHESENKFSSIFHKSPCALTLVSAQDGTFVDVNEAFLNATGYTRDEVKGKTADLLKIFADKNEGKKLARLLREQKIVHDIEMRCRIKSGEIRLCLFSSDVILIGDKPHILSTVTDITEQRHAEEALRESEKKYHALFSAESDGIVVADRESGVIIDCNDAFLTMYGYHKDEVIGQEIIALSAEPVTNQTSTTTDGKFIPVRYHKRKDGSTFPVEMTTNGITLDGREVVIGAIRDITERKRAEAALRIQSETLSILNSIISAANKADTLPHLLTTILTESLHLLDFDAGGIYLVNHSTRTAEVVESRNLSPEFLAEARTVPVDTSPYDTLFIKNEPIFTENYEQLNPDRQKKYGFHSLASIPLVSKGRAVGALNIASLSRCVIPPEEKQALISIGRELGSAIERMAAEDEVRKVSHNLETLFNSIDEMVFVLDMQGSILAVNNTVIKRLSYTSGELTGMHVLNLHPEELRDEALRIVQGMVAGTIDSCPIPVCTKDGIRIDVETKITRGLWYGSEVLIGVSRDITERKRAEEALSLANKKITLLNSITRHDINNQLLTLRAYLTLLEEAQSDPKHIGYFQRASTAAQQISFMIEFTKEYEAIGVNAPAWQECRTIVDTAAKGAPLGNVIVKNDLPAGMEVFADSLVTKVFYNLMDNAVRYGGKISTIRIFMMEQNGNGILVCEDDGTGVPADEKEKIFERGYGKNTGMGLFLAREILSITGITITETGEPGKGARFEMAVPKGAYRITRGAV